MSVEGGTMSKNGGSMSMNPSYMYVKITPMYVYIPYYALKQLKYVINISIEKT